MPIAVPFFLDAPDIRVFVSQRRLAIPIVAAKKHKAAAAHASLCPLKPKAQNMIAAPKSTTHTIFMQNTPLTE